MTGTSKNATSPRQWPDRRRRGHAPPRLTAIKKSPSARRPGRRPRLVPKLPSPPTDSVQTSLVNRAARFAVTCAAVEGNLGFVSVTRDVMVARSLELWGSCARRLSFEQEHVVSLVGVEDDGNDDVKVDGPTVDVSEPSEDDIFEIVDPVPELDTRPRTFGDAYLNGIPHPTPALSQTPSMPVLHHPSSSPARFRPLSPQFDFSWSAAGSQPNTFSPTVAFPQYEPEEEPMNEEAFSREEYEEFRKFIVSSSSPAKGGWKMDEDLIPHEEAYATDEVEMNTEANSHAEPVKVEIPKEETGATEASETAPSAKPDASSPAAPRLLSSPASTRSIMSRSMRHRHLSHGPIVVRRSRRLMRGQGDLEALGTSVVVESAALISPSRR
ncbi:hypothetical protein HDU96_004164 [Phlyctochytrium bullatum]|nr:hypothetical protein HDU96_004164 [Phlyctochytrium bullatum]